MCFPALFPYGTGDPTNHEWYRWQKHWSIWLDMENLLMAFPDLFGDLPAIPGFHIGGLIWSNDTSYSPKHLYTCTITQVMRIWPSMISGPWLIPCRHSNWWPALCFQNSGIISILVSAIPGIAISFGAKRTSLGPCLTFISFRHTPQAHHPELSDARLWLTAHTLRIGIFQQASGFCAALALWVSWHRLALVSAWIPGKGQYTCLNREKVICYQLEFGK